MRRRSFIAGAAAFGGGLVLNQIYKSIPKRQGSAHIVTSKWRNPEGVSHEDFDRPGELRIFSLNDGQVREFELPIIPHVFAQQPNRPAILLGSTKHGRQAVVVDVDASKVLRTLIAPSRSSFYGHCAFSADGNKAFLTGHSSETQRGTVCVFDTDNWKLLEVVPSGGIGPHDCQLTAAGDILVINPMIAENETTGVISLLDTQSFEIKKKWLVPTVSHVLQMGPELLLSGLLDGVPTQFITLNLETNRIRNYLDAAGELSHPLVGEGLSVCRLTESEVAVSIPSEKTVLRWNLTTNRRTLLEAPTGVTGLVAFNGEIFANSQTGDLYRFPATAPPPRLNQRIAKFANGRHLRLFYF